jgi:protein dithiol oxidoreductase (disulfide-forming)
MRTNRRNFVASLAILSNFPGISWALTNAVEGKNYTKLSRPIPVADPAKIEVVEFFGYWCPHCAHFEPKLEAWVKKLPQSVSFRRLPVAWQSSQELLQRLYFALEVMSVTPEFHQKVFDAIHVKKLRLDTESAISSFAKENALDPEKIISIMKGFTVSAKLNSAKQTLASYNIEGVPTLAVNGQYLTSPEQAGGEEASLEVIDSILKKISKNG